MIINGASSGASTALSLLNQSNRSNQPSAPAATKSSNPVPEINRLSMDRLNQLINIFKSAAGNQAPGTSEAFQNRIDKSMAAAANFVRTLSDDFAKAPVVAVSRAGEGTAMNGQKLASADADPATALETPRPRSKNEGGEQTASTGNAVQRMRGTDGKDTIVASADKAASAKAGQGSDNVTADAERVGTVNGGKGHDRIKVAAEHARNIFGGDGRDKIGVNAESVERINGGNGRDKIDVRSMSVEAINAGRGDDKVRVRTVTAGEIDGGRGNDTMHIAALTATVSGGKGDDFISMNVESGKMVFGAGDGNDNVRVARGSQLLLSFGEGLSRENLQLEWLDDNGRELVLRFDSGESVTLDGVHRAESISLSFADGDVVPLVGEATTDAPPALDAIA